MFDSNNHTQHNDIQYNDTQHNNITTFRNTFLQMLTHEKLYVNVQDLKEELCLLASYMFDSYNHTKHHYSQHNDIQNNSKKHNEIQHNNTYHDDIQFNDTQHNNLTTFRNTFK